MNRVSAYKLVVSDFHLGSGRKLPDGTINPLEDFFMDEKFIEFLEYHGQGPFKSAAVELILNGDFLNLLQVDYMREFPDDFTEEVSLFKLRKVFQGHPEVWDALARFAQRPSHGIVYTIGNHDPGVLWDGVKSAIRERIGAEVQFPVFSYTFGGVWVEHGNQHEVANRYNPNQLFLFKDMPKPILAIPWGSLFVIHILNELKKERPFVDKVTPFRNLLRWALVFDTGFALRALYRSLEFFFQSAFSRSRSRRFPLRTSLGVLREWTSRPRLDKAAQRLLETPSIHTVIFGHVHHPLVRRLDEGKLYLNTGTWNEMIGLDFWNFGLRIRLTYAYLEEKNGRWEARLKQWKGQARVEEDVYF